MLGYHLHTCLPSREFGSLRPKCLYCHTTAPALFCGRDFRLYCTNNGVESGFWGCEPCELSTINLNHTYDTGLDCNPRLPETLSPHYP
jgi:hypothetical protein